MRRAAAAALAAECELLSRPDCRKTLERNAEPFRALFEKWAVGGVLDAAGLKRTLRDAHFGEVVGANRAADLSAAMCARDGAPGLGPTAFVEFVGHVALRTAPGDDARARVLELLRRLDRRDEPGGAWFDLS